MSDDDLEDFLKKLEERDNSRRELVKKLIKEGLSWHEACRRAELLIVG